LKVLFVCSRNQWRSPTAERVWRRLPGVEVRSAGVSGEARRVVRAEDIAWADRVFVMEATHKKRLAALFPERCATARIEVLEVPDDYRFMDPELVAIFEDLAVHVLGDPG
jgi:predicted protein tyrosine phosphatase